MICNDCMNCGKRITPDYEIYPQNHVIICGAGAIPQALAFERCPWPSLMTPRKPKLLPCPFCGYNSHYLDDGLAVCRHSEGCYLVTRYAKNYRHEISDIEGWNKRAKQ